MSDSTWVMQNAHEQRENTQAEYSMTRNVKGHGLFEIEMTFRSSRCPTIQGLGVLDRDHSMVVRLVSAWGATSACSNHSCTTAIYCPKPDI